MVRVATGECHTSLEQKPEPNIGAHRQFCDDERHVSRAIHFCCGLFRPDDTDMGLSKVARRLENDSDSVVKVGCATSAISWRFPRCGRSQTRLLCPFPEESRWMCLRLTRGLADSKLVQRKLRPWGSRFHVRFAVGCELVGCTQRVAALRCQWRSSRHGTGVVCGVVDKWCLCVR